MPTSILNYTILSFLKTVKNQIKKEKKMGVIETDHSQSSSAKVIHTWLLLLLPLQVFIARKEKILLNMFYDNTQAQL
jgi:hypothetical protein